MTASSFNKAVVNVCCISFLIVLCVFPTHVMAAKKRVKVISQNAVSYSSAKLSRSTNSIIVNFLNLNQVTKATYELTYNANGISQGVTGSLSPSGANSESRDLYFGTCSKGVCTPHTNITNAELLVQITKKNNAVTTKLYRIRI
jgi:hypothetical protein